LHKGHSSLSRDKILHFKLLHDWTWYTMQSAGLGKSSNTVGLLFDRSPTKLPSS
jgi:hypothetical protein